jgi:predicted transglutaminase-like cysteine proteinase
VKYFVLRELGIPASHVRLLIVHAHHRNENHMVVAVYLEGQWLILDNLTLALLRDNDEVGFTPLFVLDNSGVRLIRSP